MLQFWFVVNTLFWPWSLSSGEMKLSLSVAVLVLAGLYRLGERPRIKARVLGIVGCVLVYALFSMGTVLAGSCRNGIIKLLATVPILIFLLLVGLEIGTRATDAHWLSLQRAAKWTLGLAISAFPIEMLFPSYFPNTAAFRVKGEWSGFFYEPSQVAIGLFPSLAVLLVSESKIVRRQGIMGVIALIVFSHSSTLVALIVAWLLYRLLVQRKMRQTLILGVGVGLVIGLGAILDYTSFILPTVIRVSGVLAPGETGDLSSLVYIKGWQDAWFNVTHTYGAGLGLNMMGCGTLPDSSAREAMLIVTHGVELNAQDGSFVFSKVVSETGLIGVVFYIFAVRLFLKLEKRIRVLGPGQARSTASTQGALIFCFLATSFIRGSGYFDAWFLIGVAALGGALRKPSEVIGREHPNFRKPGAHLEHDLLERLKLVWGNRTEG